MQTVAKMVDCLDKQQHHHQHQKQEDRREPLFWSHNQQHQQRTGQPSQSSQLSALSNGSNSQFTSQQPNNQSQQQILVDLQSVDNPDETASSEANQLQRQQQGPNSDLIGYYFGSISRETAEWILLNHSNQLDGAYLLRSSGPKDDFVLSLLVVHPKNAPGQPQLEVLHYKIIETEDSFVALHGRVGDEKFATIDELIERAQGVATKPKWPIQRHLLESQILPPTFWGLTVDQIRLAILIKAKQWGFPLSIFQQPTGASLNGAYQTDHQQALAMKGLVEGNALSIGRLDNHPEDQHQNCINPNTIGGSATTLNNETIRTLIYKSLHEFQPWFHGRISRDEAEARIEDVQPQRDGRFLVRERDNYSYAMCISHKRTTKHYRIDVLSTGELAIQDGRKFTSLMALVSHYTIMSDGLWCALTEPCPRPILQQPRVSIANKALKQGPQMVPATIHDVQRYVAGLAAFPVQQRHNFHSHNQVNDNNIYCVPPSSSSPPVNSSVSNKTNANHVANSTTENIGQARQNASTTAGNNNKQASNALMCPSQSAAVLSIKAPIKEWLHTINNKWSQMIASKTNQQHQSLNSFLFGPSNPLNNHCRHKSHHHHHHHHNHIGHHQGRHRRSKSSCPRQQQQQQRTAANKNISQQHQQAIMMNGNCECCPAATVRPVPNGLHPAVLAQRQLHGRMTAAGGAEGGPSRAHPADNLILHYANGNGTNNGNGNGNNNNNSNNSSNNGHANGAGGDQLVPSGLVAASSSAISTSQQTKVLFSCLPQNSGFMLDSQSFIGSPLFAVKTNNSQTNATNKQAVAAATIDGLNGACGGGIGTNRAGACLNGGMGGRAATSGGSTNNVEKLISPAHSISVDLNGPHHRNQPQQAEADANLYGLSTEIYGSQTSTAVVNDRLQTSSSSSSSNNRLPKQQQQHQPQSHHLTAGFQQSLQHAANRTMISNQTAGVGLANECMCYGTTSNHGKLSGNTQTCLRPAQTNNHCTKQSGAPVDMGVPHAGPILCGQHAGPAYRYTNCTGNQDYEFRQCLHATALGARLSDPSQLRAADDLQLLQATNGTQLAGPAALTKFVQFQDGQCLRTHRDTKSIQMAYLLSRQEALNVLNNRANQQTSSSSNFHRQPIQPQRQTNFASAATHQHAASNSLQANMLMRLSNGATMTRNGSNPSASPGRAVPCHLSNMGNNLSGQNQQHQQQDEEIEYDLIDCDGSGFQFKYDPKLIKSSSIETLCGIGDDDHEDEDHVIEDLSHFKTNSELLMSLKPFWITTGFTQPNNDNFGIKPLTPMVAVDQNTSPCETTNNGLSDGYLHENGSNDRMGSLLLEGCREQSTQNASTLLSGNQLEPDESWTRKHNLDELTTSLLAELTASLKAQVDLKNKRSGLYTTTESNQERPLKGDCLRSEACEQENSSDRNNGLEAKTYSVRSKPNDHNNGQRPLESNPLELIEEFDTLIRTNK